MGWTQIGKRLLAKESTGMGSTALRYTKKKKTIKAGWPMISDYTQHMAGRDRPRRGTLPTMVSVKVYMNQQF